MSKKRFLVRWAKNVEWVKARNVTHEELMGKRAGSGFKRKRTGRGIGGGRTALNKLERLDWGKLTSEKKRTNGTVR